MLSGLSRTGDLRTPPTIALGPTQHLNTFARGQSEPNLRDPRIDDRICGGNTIDEGTGDIQPGKRIDPANRCRTSAPEAWSISASLICLAERPPSSRLC